MMDRRMFLTATATATAAALAPLRLLAAVAELPASLPEPGEHAGRSGPGGSRGTRDRGGVTAATARAPLG